MSASISQSAPNFLAALNHLRILEGICPIAAGTRLREICCVPNLSAQADALHGAGACACQPAISPSSFAPNEHRTDAIQGERQ